MRAGARVCGIKVDETQRQDRSARISIETEPLGGWFKFKVPINLHSASEIGLTTDSQTV